MCARSICTTYCDMQILPLLLCTTYCILSLYFRKYMNTHLASKVLPEVLNEILSRKYFRSCTSVLPYLYFHSLDNDKKQSTNVASYLRKYNVVLSYNVSKLTTYIPEVQLHVLYTRYFRKYQGTFLQFTAVHVLVLQGYLQNTKVSTSVHVRVLPFDARSAELARGLGPESRIRGFSGPTYENFSLSNAFGGSYAKKRFVT